MLEECPHVFEASWHSEYHPTCGQIIDYRNAQSIQNPANQGHLIAHVLL